MDFLTRINAVLHHQAPDKVPFAPYDNLIPRGSFERKLRNRGAGLCLRRSTIWPEIKEVSVETKNEGDTILTIYHTPEGDVSTRSRAHLSRISDTSTVEIEGMIKSTTDYDPVINMLENTTFHADNSVYYNTVRDLGADGIFRDSALDHESSPYAATRRYFGYEYGLESWIYAQKNHPDHFAELVNAQLRRDERRLERVADSPAEFLGFGWLEGLWSPKQFRENELSFYQKWVSYLQSKGKICALHCDATKNLRNYKNVLTEIGAAVIEAFTPTPVGEISLPEAREAWGQDTTIWINFPETIFWKGEEATRQYTKDLLLSDPPGNALVISFTEMGLWGATDEVTRNVFQAGTLAILETIDQFGVYPIRN
jgi:hypothetical protein